jgi:hypothetical protein
MKNFIAQSMRRMGLAPKNKVTPSSPNGVESVSGTAPLAHMTVGSKWSYSTLQYPEDIQGRSDMGHYMMFYVNVPNTSRSKYGRTGGAGSKKKMKSAGAPGRTQEDTGNLSPEEKMITERGGTSKDANAKGYTTTGETWHPGQTNRVIERKSHQGAVSKQTNQTDRTVRTTDSIVLYMPPQVTQNTSALYKETEIGGEIMETAGRAMHIMSRAEALGGGVGGGWDAMKEALPGIAGQVKSAMFRGAAKATSALMGGDALAAYDKYSNRAMNNFLETTFTGVGFRKFSYSWKFTPKSIKEVITAQEIIKTFRFHMLPELPEDGDFGRYYIVPAEFDIFYMFRGDENTWFNKLVTSVLVNMDVNYTPNQYQTFRPIENKPGAPPTEIDMKLDFMETKIITKDDVQLGF